MKAAYLAAHLAIVVGLLALTQFAFLVFLPVYALAVFLGPDLRAYFRRRHPRTIVAIAVSAFAQTLLLAALLGLEWFVLARMFQFDWPSLPPIFAGIAVAYFINVLVLAILKDPPASPGMPMTSGTATTR